MSQVLHRCRWRSPSNIALVKYWGKKAVQLPMNGSLSMTLSRSFSEMEVSLVDKREGTQGKDFIFTFEDGNQSDKFSAKIQQFIDRLRQENLWFFAADLGLKISSSNSFPHSSGIASSASSYSALALCLCTLEEELKQKQESKISGKESEDFWRKASSMARLGSGSACRSLYGGFVEWKGEGEEAKYGSDIPSAHINPLFRHLHDVICIVDSSPKKVSSSLGHSMMEGHAYAKARFTRAAEHLFEIKNILQMSAQVSGDFMAFARLVEAEALDLHAMMMTSKNAYCLMRPETLKVIETIKRWREDEGLPVCFTLDAGPNVHVLFPKNEIGNLKVLPLVRRILPAFCEQGRLIEDETGEGPTRFI